MPEGIIREGELYTLEQFKERLCLSNQAYWNLAKKGLPDRQIGKRKFIIGKEAIAWFASRPARERDDSGVCDPAASEVEEPTIAMESRPEVARKVGRNGKSKRSAACGGAA
jgi:hypothetical protein